MRNAHEVAGAQRLVAEIGKTEPGRAHGHERHGDLAADALDLTRNPLLSPGNAQPQPIHDRLHVRAAAKGIDLLAGEFEPPVILLRRQVRYNGLLLEQRDEGQEKLAVEPILVEPVRRDIGRGDQRNAPGEQLAEQPVEQHGIGDVMDVEFIEAEQAQAGFEDGPRHRLDRIGAIGIAPFRLAEGGDAPMHLIHEFMKMQPPFLLERHGGKEQVHEHGLAAPDLAVKIKSAHALRLFEQAENPLGLGGHKVRQNPVQIARRVALRRIGRQGMAGDEIVIGGQNGTGR